MTDTLDDIVVDNWGGEVTATITQSGVAYPIDGFTTLELIFISPRGVSTTKTAVDGVEFSTDGTDGIISYIVEEGLLDVAGIWTLRGRVANLTSSFTSIEKTFDVAHAA
jgi:hypothetical protein